VTVVVEVAAGRQRAGRAAAMALSVALAAGGCAHGAVGALSSRDT
jgi:hypothetical protein